MHQAALLGEAAKVSWSINFLQSNYERELIKQINHILCMLALLTVFYILQPTGCKKIWLERQ